MANTETQARHAFVSTAFLCRMVSQSGLYEIAAFPKVTDFTRSMCFWVEYVFGSLLSFWNALKALE